MDSNTDLTASGGYGEGASGLGFEMLAASLRADQTDARAFLGALAVKLEGALPGQAVVTRARDGLFKNTTHVERITVDLPPYRYTLNKSGRSGLEATRAKFVGGISIKSEGLGLDAWIESLARSLQEYAASSASARAALERLLM